MSGGKNRVKWPPCLIGLRSKNIFGVYPLQLATLPSVGSKIHASGREGGGWYLISGLRHKISCQTRNTIESLLKVKVARPRTLRYFHLQLVNAYFDVKSSYAVI